MNLGLLVVVGLLGTLNLDFKVVFHCSLLDLVLDTADIGFRAKN